ncbi:MAG: hypothetical protein ACEPO2_18020 [Pelagibaca sp.]
MRPSLKKLVFSATFALALTGLSVPMPARAQTYPIDCAILLCLAGGWPASVPCARARAEFIRRITPWPIEPPLQIWRCPMRASYETVPPLNGAERILDAVFKANGNGPNQSFPKADFSPLAGSIEADWHLSDGPSSYASWDQILRLVQDRADIDISGPEFNFVRSIRVFDVRFVRQRASDNTGECNRGEKILLGTYGTQGNFAWQASSTAALPAAHSGLERYGEDCPELYHSSVFVEWRDYGGRYGFEQVNY